MPEKFYINPDITKAETLPASFYKNQAVFNSLKKNVFLKTWQWIGDKSLVSSSQSVYPFILMDGFLNEPMLLTQNKHNSIQCLTNVCTHRGNLLALDSSNSKKLTCKYHGRRFDLNGKIEYMPEFEKAKDFPRPCDHLHQFPIRKFGSLLFIGLNPVFDFQQIIDKMYERIGFLPLEKLSEDKSKRKEFTVDAHWALYCDNYLEGFHIPFVHEGLNEVLNYGNYTTETYQYCNLQIGYADDDTSIFNLPENHLDYGKKVAAYYYWAFPNMMFNFYPWGLSLNIIEPITINKTKVSFITYVLDESKLEQGAGSGLEKVEMEDEEVVENVQKGIKSSFYKAGRFSPTREQGVHHFHSLLAEFLNTN